MASAAPSRGALIVLEGLDRSGKSSQSERLRAALAARGHPVLLWRFPDRASATGQVINAYLASGSELADAAIHLLFSANRWEKASALEAALAAGTSVICDRYAYSGAAFTAAKHVPGLDLAWCKAPDRGLPAADALVFLSVSADVAAARGGYGAERYERADFQVRGLRGGRGGALLWSFVRGGGSVPIATRGKGGAYRVGSGREGEWRCAARDVPPASRAACARSASSSPPR